MREALSKEAAVEVFDQLVSEGIIAYGPYETIQEDCGGYPLEFRICPFYTKKPHKLGSVLDSTFDKSRKWGPGSDMYCPDERLIITTLNGTHDLALNMFSADRPQFMLVTTDSYRRQSEPLDLDDIAAALETVKTFDEMYIIYNCGEAGGCSREHKHLQGLLGPPAAFEKLVHATKDDTSVPFQYYIHHFKDGLNNTPAADVLVVYKDLLDRAKEALGLPKESRICPHNFVLWRDWIVVIPRRRGAFGMAAANTAGILGSVWLHDRKLVDEWRKLGCRQVLKELGVPPPRA